MTDKSFTVDEIVNNVAKVTFSNGEHTFIELEASMDEADFDDAVLRRMPASLVGGEGTPSFLTEGSTRTAAEKTITTPDPTYVDVRQALYGTPEEQLEYITENGLAAWQTKVAEIKANNPKPSED